jgi:hypothetical protein
MKFRMVAAPDKYFASSIRPNISGEISPPPKLRK